MLTIIHIHITGSVDPPAQCLPHLKKYLCHSSLSTQLHWMTADKADAWPLSAVLLQWNVCMFWYDNFLLLKLINHKEAT